MKTRNAQRRFLYLFLPSMLAYAVILIVVARLAKTQDFSTAATVGLSLLPVFAILLAAFAMVRYLGEIDEFMRSRMAFHLLVGLGTGVLVTFAYGLTELVADTPSLPILWVLPVSLACVGVSQLVEHARHGTDPC